MKQLRLKKSLCVISIFALFTACIDSESYTPPSSGTVPGENPLGQEVNIPDGFDWSTIKKVDLSVDVSDTQGTYYYTVEVFDENPITSPDATLLLTGYAKKGNPFTTQFTIPSGMNTVFVRETTSTKLAAIRCVEVIENKISVDFGGERIHKKNRITTRTPDVIDRTNTTNYPTTIPSDAASISGNSGVKPAGNYKVNASTSGIQGGNNAVYYVEENTTLTLTNPVAMKIYVMPGYTLTLNGDLTAGDQFFLSVGKDSKLVVNHLKSEGKSTVYNQGAIEAASWSVSGNSEVYNSGTVTVGGSTTLQSADHTWMNDGTWITKDMTVTGYNPQNIVYRKLLVQNKLVLNQGYMEMGDLSYIQTAYLDKTKSIVQMGRQAYFYVTELARFESNYIGSTHLIEMDGKTHSIGEGFYGPYKSDSDPERLSREFWALLRITKADFLNSNNKENALQLHHDLQLVCDDAFAQQMGSIKTWHVNGTAEWASEDNASIVIPGEEDGGNSPGYEPGGENPREPDTENPIVSNQTYSYIFEDLWPKYGDYDMNDIVIYVEHIAKTMNTHNKVKKLAFNYTLKAIGATKKIAAALMLDEILADEVLSVSYENHVPVTFDIHTTGTEKGQTQAVIPLFDNAHELLGKQNSVFVNTIKNSPENVDNPPVCTVVVEFKSPVDLEKIDIAAWNLFIITDINLLTQTAASDNRVEIHLMNYAPTQKANTQLFGQMDDKSTVNIPYISAHNLTWGMLIPDAFRWPAEYINITHVYPKFVDWVTTGGDENKDWYKEPGNGVY